MEHLSLESILKRHAGIVDFDVVVKGFRGIDGDLTRIAGIVAEQRVAVGAVHLQGVEIGVA